MSDILLLARSIASQVHRDRYAELKGVTLPCQPSSHAEMAALIDAGEMDDCIAMRAVLSALKATSKETGQ